MHKDEDFSSGREEASALYDYVLKQSRVFSALTQLLMKTLMGRKNKRKNVAGRRVYFGFNEIADSNPYYKLRIY